MIFYIKENADKIINQINTINNINNYDIELDDNVFFDTLNNFMTLLSQEIILVYTKTYKYVMKEADFENQK